MDLLKEIGNAKKIAIAGHIRPDGDCISSCLSLSKYLENALGEVDITVFMEPNPPTIFSYLKGYSDMRHDYGTDEVYDVFITVDVSALDRLGNALPIFERAGKRICIDHHESNTGLAEANEIKPYACSTCEVLYDIFDKKYIDSDIAEALFSGIVHDSGVFQYSNMSRHSFEIVGHLIEYDFDGPKIIQETFYQKSYAQNQIMGKVLMDSKLYMDGKCIVGMVDKEMMNAFGVLPKHLDGIVNQLQNTRGVEIAIFMYELDDKRCKVSMRSNGNINVADIAVSYSGGGHAKAAGCEMEGTYQEMVDSLLQSIQARMNS